MTNIYGLSGTYFCIQMMDAWRKKRPFKNISERNRKISAVVSHLTIKKRDADHYAIWLEHARKLETFVRNLQIQLRIIIIKTFHLEFNSTSSLVSSSGFQFWELNSIRQKRTQKCFYSLSILTATWSTVNITFACHQLVSPSASLDSCISFKNADRLLADFFLVVLFGNLFGTFSISSNVVIIPDYSDFFLF